MPFLRYLYHHPHIPKPDVNCWEGYGLTRAVAAGFIPLVQFLLSEGASPACKGGIAVHAAIRRKNLPLVKMLIEPDPTVQQLEEDPHAPARKSAASIVIRRKKRQVEDVPALKLTGKKRKLEDRLRVDQQMLRTAVTCDARDVVKYFMEEKSCMPDMQTVRKMRH